MDEEDANEGPGRGKEHISELFRGTCGSCGLRLLFWSKDEATVECPKCGSEHEVERGVALNLTSKKMLKWRGWCWWSERKEARVGWMKVQTETEKVACSYEEAQCNERQPPQFLARHGIK